MNGNTIQSVIYASDPDWPCFIVMQSGVNQTIYYASNNLKNCEVAEKYHRESNKKRVSTTIYVRLQGNFKIVEAIEVVSSEVPNYNPYPPPN